MNLFDLIDIPVSMAKLV